MATQCPNPKSDRRKVVMIKAIISLSGGMDSATALAVAISEGRMCMGIGFDYGAKHNQYELIMAKKLACYYNVPFQLINLKEAMKGFQSRLMIGGGDIPEGHYADDSMSETVVPARNIIFISILAGVAWSNEAREVWMGVHASSPAIYPDCTPQFIYPMDKAIKSGTGGRVRLVAPFVHLFKPAIVKRGIALKVPYNLTRTCFKQQEKACGKCGCCRKRLEAFSKNGVEDPIEYEE